MSAVDPSKLATQTFDWGVIKWLVVDHLLAGPGEDVEDFLRFRVVVAGMAFARQQHDLAEGDVRAGCQVG